MKSVVIPILLLVLVACNNSYRTLEEGTWFDPENEIHAISITERNDTLFLVKGREKYIINEKKYESYIYRDQIKHPVWQEGNKLMFDKKVYIPQSETLHDKFLGVWTNEEAQLTINSISEGGNALAWEIKDSRQEEFKYYPKRKDNTTMMITYMDEILEFEYAGEYLLDSKNRKFYKEKN